MTQHRSQKNSTHRARTIATGVASLALSVVVLSACTNERSDQVVLQQQDAAEAEPRHASDPSYDSHSEAAIAAARDRDPELTNPAVTNAILIFTDQTTVDLRAQVKADDGYCQWFGVNAELTETALRRRAG